MADPLIQRVIFPLNAQIRSLYFHCPGQSLRPCPEPVVCNRRSVVLSAGQVLSIDSYFNRFFESYWRRYTTLNRLALRIRLSGRGTLRLFRESPVYGQTLLAIEQFDRMETDPAMVLEVPGRRVYDCEYGSLYFEIAALEGDVQLHQAEWLALDAVCKPVQMVAGYCTFHREKELLENLANLLADDAAADRLYTVVVVDQGDRKVQRHPGHADLPARASAKVRFVEQGNFGGAGGFTRAIVEAAQTKGATHMLLMDDDGVLEPESIFRTHAFFSLAREEFALGGNILNLLHATRLWEAGVNMNYAAMTPVSHLQNRNLEKPETLRDLMRVEPSQVSGWTYFGFPLSVLKKAGYPLPLFIHFDDLEFGIRLTERGIPTLNLPSLAVWHEPFDTKPVTWQWYYNIRNKFILCTLHARNSRRAYIKYLLRNLLIQLLHHDYYASWLICEGAEAFCQGPPVLEQQPQATQRRLLAAKKEYGESSIPKSVFLPPRSPRTAHPAKWRRRLEQVRTLCREVFGKSPARDVEPVGAIQGGHLHWSNFTSNDVIAVDNPYHSEYLVFRRSRGLFLRLLYRGAKTAVHLLVSHKTIMQSWRGAVGRLTREDFWTQYLEINVSAEKAECQRSEAA